MQSIGLQRAGHNQMTELTELSKLLCVLVDYSFFCGWVAHQGLDT